MANNHDFENLSAALAGIDPHKRLRWLDASAVLRSINTPEAERAWLDWSAPLGLTEDVIALWKAMEAPPCAGPLAELRTIAKRRGCR